MPFPSTPSDPPPIFYESENDDSYGRDDITQKYF